MVASSLKHLGESFHRLRRRIGVDRAVFYSVLSRAFSTAGNLVTIPLILTRLTAVEQGFYYTFGSILAMQVFLELGFGQVAIQMVAHEAAHIRIDLNTGISGENACLDHFSATVGFIRRWYIVLAIIIGLLLFPAGVWFFSASSVGFSVNWLGPWSIMAFSTAAGVVVRSLSAIVEGMGFVAESIRVNLWGGAVQVLLTIVGLLAGLKLYAVPIASLVALTVNFAFVWHLSKTVVRDASNHGKHIRIDWKEDVLPYQWRIALSWMSGWFIFSAMLPVVFRQLGPAEAGRFGLAVSISTFISTFAINWSSTKAAIYGQMASRKDWKAMDALFWRVAPQAVGIAAVASIFALMLVPHLGDLIPRFAGRVPDSGVLFLLCSVTVMNQVISAEAFYLRAHKREPFLANSIFSGLAMGIGLFCFTHASVLSIAVMYTALTVVGLIWASVVFVYCRFHWHSITQ